MRVMWEVEDGHAGKARPHYTDVPSDELDGLNEDARDDLIEHYIEEDFRNRIWFRWRAMG